MRRLALFCGGGLVCTGDASSVLRIDPETNECSLVGTLSDEPDKWQGGFLGANGVIFCIPENADRVLRIVPPGCGGTEAARAEGKKKKKKNTRDADKTGLSAVLAAAAASGAAAVGPTEAAAAAATPDAGASLNLNLGVAAAVAAALALGTALGRGRRKKEDPPKPAARGKRGWA